MATQNLTDVLLKSLKPRNKPYKITDAKTKGLFIEVSKIGKKVFRLNYTFASKSYQLTLGPYPEISLLEAREKALSARKQIVAGIDPAAAKKAEKAKRKANTLAFRTVAEEWMAAQRTWADVTLDDTRKRLNLHVFPRIGEQPIASIAKADIKAILDTLQAQGNFSVLKKVRSNISLILRYAIDHEIPGVEVDWTAQLRKQYVMPPSKHRAAITKTEDIRGLLEAIDSYEDTSLLTCLALKFSALTFCRPGEIRHAEWNEIDFEEKIWTIPAEKMKMRQGHKVPLSRQSLQVLEQLRPLSGHSKYLFPSVRTPDRPMSEATVNAAIRRMGYEKDKMCAHGFRGMASTKLNEKGFNRDWIECQLAHRPQDSVRAAYNHADFLDGRREMMQAWADFLENLRSGNNDYSK